MKQELTIAIDLKTLASRDILSYIKTNVTLLPSDNQQNGEEKKEEEGGEKEVQLHVAGTGDWDKCYDIVKDFTQISEPFYKKCKSSSIGGDVTDRSCPDDGIQIPPVLQLDQTEFYGFSEFWYTMEDVLDLGGPYNTKRFQAAAKVEFI